MTLPVGPPESVLQVAVLTAVASLPCPNSDLDVMPQGEWYRSHCGIHGLPLTHNTTPHVEFDHPFYIIIAETGELRLS